MEESTANIQVVEMEQRNFRNYWSYFHNMYAERKRDVDGFNVEFSRAVWFNFGIGEEVVDGRLQEKEHVLEVWVRYTHDITEKPKESFISKEVECHLQFKSLAFSSICK